MINLLYKRAFSLAEVLVTLLVMSIVTLLALPQFWDGIDSLVSARQRNAFSAKFRENLLYMQSNDKLSINYDSTKDFVTELKNYMSVALVCNNYSLQSCFSKEINGSRGELLYDTNSFVSTEDLGADFSSDLMGVLFLDGSSAIIGYRKDCHIQDTASSLAELTACMVVIYDVDGVNGGNILNYDIGTINLSLSSGNSKYENLTVFTPVPLSKEECEKAVNEGKLSTSNCSYDEDYWAGAVLECQKQGKQLPSQQQLAELATSLYGQTIQENMSYRDLSVTNYAIWNGLGGETANILSSQKDNSSNMYYRHFELNSTEKRTAQKNFQVKAFCQ